LIGFFGVGSMSTLSTSLLIFLPIFNKNVSLSFQNSLSE